MADGTAIRVFGGRRSGGSDTVDGSALTGNRRIAVNAGGGLDVLKGGGRDDLFLFRAADLAGDSVEGGGGNDTLQLTTAGTITADELALVSGVERIQLANGTNALTLTDANFVGVFGVPFTVLGGSGSDTIDASGLENSINLDITSGGGLDVLKGGDGSNTFRFAAADLAGDTVAGLANATDQLILTTAGEVVFDGLANVTGIDTIGLAAGGNAITLTDANYTVVGTGAIEVRGSAGSSTIDAADLTGFSRIRYFAGGGIDTVLGGAGEDRFFFLGGNVFQAGSTIDGGAGLDTISVDRSMSFLGNGITGVEELRTSAAALTITLSGEIAAGLTQINNDLDFEGGRTQTVNIQLSAGSTTDLSNLTLVNVDAADAINVVSTSGATSVTLSASIASFTGSADADTVSLAPGGGYKDDAVISGGGGNDRIAFDASLVTLDGGAGNDTLVVRGSAEIDLRNPGNQNPGFSSELSIVANFENVDASASTEGVTLTGRDDAFSFLTGGSGADTIEAGAGGARITGGLGADVLTGGLNEDTFVVRSTEEAQGDKMVGGDDFDRLKVTGDADLTGAAISGIETLFLQAENAFGAISENVTATVSGALASSGIEIEGGSTPATVETLVVNHSGTSPLNLSTRVFNGWGSEDLVVINGTNGADTITGTGQNDVINGGFGADTLFGVGGDDVIGYSQLSTQEINGGTGNDTIRLDNLAAPGVLEVVDVNLGLDTILESRSDGNSTSIFARAFENADFSLNTIATTLTGSAVANVLIGGSVGDLIIGEGGSDTLTGGEGTDRFFWSDKAEGGDTITDFTRGEDRLEFDSFAFTFSGSTFNTVTFDSGFGTLNLNDTDVLIAGQTLESADEVRAFVNNNSTSTQHGMFVVATTTSGSRVLYYTSNASALGPDNAFFQIADLGAGVAPQLSDFVFI